jgi:hypothetical protein
LQQIGRIHKLGSSSDDDDEFMFVAKCGGAQALIFPLLWTDARVEGVPDSLESVFITEGDLSYVIRSWEEPREGDAEGSNKAAETQLAEWATLKAKLHISFLGPFPAIFFFGTLTVRDNGLFAATHDSGVWYLFSCRDAVCKREKRGEHTTIQIKGDQYTVWISETELTMAEMIQRFLPASRAVH